MRLPHVLVVASSFPPNAAVGTFRTLRLVEHAADAGWTFTVLTGTPGSYLAGTPIDPALVSRVPNAAAVVRAPTLRVVDRVIKVVRGFIPRKGGAGQRPMPRAVQQAPAAGQQRPSLSAQIQQVFSIPDQEIGWFLPAVARALAHCWRRRPDVIYSSAPPWTGHLVAYILAFVTRRPWVADFRDPWARAPWRSARMLPFERWAAAWLEGHVVSAADALVFTTNAARDEFATRYGTHVAAKCHVVRNGCDPAIFDGITARPRADRFLLLHAGSLYGRRDPVPLLRAIAAAMQQGRIDRQRFSLRFVGMVGLPDFDLLRVASELGLDGVVEYVPRVSHRESLIELRSASALLLLQPGTTMSVPAKTFEYLAAGRPVLALAEEGETAEIVRASGMGLAVAPSDEGAIANALVALMQADTASTTQAPRELFDGRCRSAEMMAILTNASVSRTGSSSRGAASPRRWERWGF